MAIAGGPALGKMLRWCQCFILWEEIWHIVASQDEGIHYGYSLLTM